MKSYIIRSGIVRDKNGEDIIKNTYQRTIDELKNIPDLLGLELTIDSRNQYKVLHNKELGDDLQWIHVFNDTFTDNLEREIFGEKEWI